MQVEINPRIPVFRERRGLCLSPVPFYVKVVGTELPGDGGEQWPPPWKTASGPKMCSTKWTLG